MRLKVFAAMASLCLFAAGAAYAAGPVTGGPNSYTGNFLVSNGAQKSPTRPVELAETLGMSSTTPGNVGAPLVDIKTTTYGVKANQAPFPKCTINQINEDNGHNGKWNKVCPPNSLVATGSVKAALTSPNANLAGPGAPCLLGLWVYNGGPGKLTFFFTTTPAKCDGLSTGAAAAWLGTIRQAGKTLETNVPEPPDVSYNAGNIGLFGSLESEKLVFKKATAKVGHKVVPLIQSLGCQGGSRPFSISYTATTTNTPSASNESGATVKGTQKC